MIRKITLLTFCLFCIFITQAEESYLHFVVDGKEWICSYGDHVYNYTIEGDTVIGNADYKKVYICAEYIYSDQQQHYFGAVKEIDSQIYLIKDKEDEASLLYDFAIQRGDTIGSLRYLSEGIRCINGVNRKAIDLVKHAPPGEAIPTRCWTWIEGIGCLEDPFDINNWDYSYNIILSCYENDICIYNKDGIYNSILYPSTENHTLTLHREGYVLMAVFPSASAGEAITLYDATGRVVATQPIRTGATTATIDITALPAGVYIARLNSGATAKVVL